MIAALTDRVRRVRTVATRATLTPLLLRCGVFLCALAAFTVAYPAPVLASRVTGVLLLVAALPALWPRGWGATLVAVGAVGGWILDTTWYEQPVALWRLLALAGLLYLVHTLAALAAVLPYDAVVATEVVAHWLARAFAVVLGSAVLAVTVLALTGAAGGGAFLAASLLGLVVAVGVAGLLAWLPRRP